MVLVPINISKFHNFILSLTDHSAKITKKKPNFGHVMSALSKEHFLSHYRASRYLSYRSFLSCNRPITLYKTHINVANYCKLKLSGDIEKTPGPAKMYVDPNKTMAAPYNQGNVELMQDSNVLQ